MWSLGYQKLEQQTGLRNSRLDFDIIPIWPPHSKYFILPDTLF